MGQRTEIVISRAGDKHSLHIDLTTQKPKYRSNPYSEPKSVAASLLDKSIANLKVSMFPGYVGIEFANEVSAAFDGMLHDASRLLIDLRGNPGGGIGGLRIMSYLTPSKTPIGFSLDRPMAEHGYDKERLPRFGHIPRFKFQLLPFVLKFANKRSIALVTEGFGRRPFHGRVAILVNEHSTGAAEMLAQFAQENRLATIVGSKTAGRIVSRSGIKMGNGYTLVLPVAAYMSWNGAGSKAKALPQTFLWTGRMRLRLRVVTLSSKPRWQRSTQHGRLTTICRENFEDNRRWRLPEMRMSRRQISLAEDRIEAWVTQHHQRRVLAGETTPTGPCPDEDFLEQLARRSKRIALSDPRIDHAANCSKCMSRLLEIRKEK